MLKIFDTTLRDGEQTNGVSYSLSEKLLIAEQLLNKVGVDFLEISSCRVSESEKNTIKKICHYANENNLIDKISVLSFIDFNRSIDWLDGTGCQKINLLTKGSEEHCIKQLRKTLEEHINDIKKTIDYAISKGLKYSFYLEDWSRGVRQNYNYVKNLSEELLKLEPQSIILCDTLGVLNPWSTEETLMQMKKDFDLSNFEFHCHNDYGLANANSLTAIKCGISTIHSTINGLGERAGNVSMVELVVSAKDHLNIDSDINEKEFANISTLIERFSSKRIPHNSPIVGKDVFTQTAGVHADGDSKGNLYQSKLHPSRFDRTTEYALGKLSGKANLEIHLKNIGTQLTDEQKKLVLEKIVNISDHKKNISQFDLPFIIADVIDQGISKIFEVVDCIITSSTSLLPVANIKIKYKNTEYYEHSSGNGGYDAFMNCLRKIATNSDLFIPTLIDFEVGIPRGGKTDALVETIIAWQDGVKTTGFSEDQVMASIKATEKAINYFAINKK
jgi:D-citramalate synthase